MSMSRASAAPYVIIAIAVAIALALIVGATVYVTSQSPANSAASTSATASTGATQTAASETSSSSHDAASSTAEASADTPAAEDSAVAPATENDSGAPAANITYPSNVYHLADYYRMPVESITDYLASQGFVFHGGLSQKAPYDQGRGNSTFFNGSTLLYFGADPFSHHIPGMCYDQTDNPLNKGRAFNGIRLCLPADNAVTGSFAPDRASAGAIAAICGLGDENSIAESCTYQTVVGPDIDTIRGHNTHPYPHFYCAYGKTGGLCWTVLIDKPSSEGGWVTVTVQPESCYSEYDLSHYGNSICNFVAYCDMFTE